MDVSRSFIRDRACLPEPRIAALVLAGGESSRMGLDKATLPLGDGETLLSAVFREALKICPQARVSRAARQNFPEYPCVEDEYADRGPLSGIVAGLSFFSAIGYDALQVLACDLPYLKAETARRLINAYKASPGFLMAAWRGRESGRTQTLAAIYSREALPTLRASLEKNLVSIKKILPPERILYLDYGPEMEKYFYNCNSPAEYAKVRSTIDSRD